MKIKQVFLGVLTAIIFSLSFNTSCFASLEDSTRVINATEKLLANPNAKNISSYIRIMKKREKYHGMIKDWEAQADDIRSLLYFFRRNKQGDEYIKYCLKLNETYEKLCFKNTPTNRLEIAKTLYLEKKYFASAYEFLELANEEYAKETCYEYLGDISIAFNNPNAAIVFYKKALEIEPENYCITYKAALAYKNENDEDNAKDFFERTINLTEDREILDSIIQIYEAELKSDPNNEKTYEILGLAYQKEKQYQKTYTLFKKAIELAPQDVFLQYYLGNLLYDMGQYKSAIQIYDTILESDPYETQIRIARAKCYGKTGNINRAIKDYQVVLALYPESRQAQFGLYTLLWGKKNLNETIKTFYPLNKNFKPDAKLYNNLADMIYQKGMVRDAVAVYKKSIAVSPKSEQAYVQLFNIYELEGQKAEAYELAKLANKNLPQNKEIMKIYRRANMNSLSKNSATALSYMEKKQYDKAIKIYQQIEPKDASIYESIAICYKSMKNYKEAVNYYTKAIKADPNNSDFYYNTALLYLDLNSKKTAQNFLSKSIELDKRNLKARKLLSYLKQKDVDSKLDKAYELFEKKDYKNALVELNHAENMYPSNPEIYYYKALTYKELGESQNAYNYFDKALDLDRSYYVSHFYMAQILEKQGKERDALKEYEKFLGADVKDVGLMKQAQNKVIELGKKYY